MSIPFDINESTSIQSTAALTQLVRAFNVREYARGVPSGDFIFPPIRRTPSGWENAPNFQAGIVQEGSNIQALGFWTRLQQAPQGWLSRFSNPNQEIAGSALLRPFQSLSEAFAVAGMVGFRRYVGGQFIGHGTIQTGDDLGPWLMIDIAKIYSVFTRRIVQPAVPLDIPNTTRIASVQRSGSSAGFQGCATTVQQMDQFFSDSPLTGIYNGLFLARAQLDFVYESSFDPFGQPQDEFWNGQILGYSGRREATVLRAGQNTDNSMRIDSIAWYSKTRNAGAAGGNIAEYRSGEFFDGAAEGTYVLALSHGGLNSPAVFEPVRSYAHPAPNPRSALGVDCDNPTGPTPVPPTESKRGTYVGIELFDTHAIYEIDYERNGL